MTIWISKFVFKRVIRDFVALGILFVTPLVLITILGMISDNAVDELLQIRRVDSVALSMILAFQLFSGFYTLELMKQDILETRKWKLRSMPIAINRYMYAFVLVTSLYSGLQSYAISHYTRLVYGVVWGNQLRLILSLLLISGVVQLFYLTLALFMKSYKTMERTATTLAFGSMMFGGVWFQFPDHLVFNFMRTYGNPYSLFQNIILDIMKSQVTSEGVVSVVIVFLIGVGLFLSSEYKGKEMYS